MKKKHNHKIFSKGKTIFCSICNKLTVVKSTMKLCWWTQKRNDCNSVQKGETEEDFVILKYKWTDQHKRKIKIKSIC